jgi:hypothetical protein
MFRGNGSAWSCRVIGFKIILTDCIARIKVVE